MPQNRRCFVEILWEILGNLKGKSFWKKPWRHDFGRRITQEKKRFVVKGDGDTSLYLQNRGFDPPLECEGGSWDHNSPNLKLFEGRFAGEGPPSSNSNRYRTQGPTLVKPGESICDPT